MIVRPILEPMVEEIKFEDLPSDWSLLDIKSFSKNKNLWDFQQNALKNIIKCLHLFFKEDHADKAKFYQRYVLNGLDRDLEKNVSIKLSKLKRRVSDIIQQYWTIEDNTIKFMNFINRSAFWMATGSGKSLVIVKLIEILKRLMDSGEIPKRDILFLTYREDLINQFKKHVDEFNELAVERGLRINLRELTEYESVKRESLIPFMNEVTVFYYRSDLIGDEQKEKIVDFRNYENGGNWYIILDEAHKGDKEESKRQMLYSIMSRNGFLFNFSATFVDISDVITTTFNFNLERFVSEGYGKHIYISKQEMRAFREKEDYNRKEKQKIVLKCLVILTYIKKIFREIAERIGNNSTYHEPLMLTLVNTVNLSEIKEEEPDLKLFFNEIERIGKGDVEKTVLEESIKELIDEFSENPSFVYEDTSINIDRNILKSITENDILRFVYNSDSPGAIEALTIPEKRQEVIFKLKTSDKPFALIKIGDAIKWIKDNLKGYEVNESYEDKSIFERIEERTEISILMGSRAFYEGWDSNRPNLILFINIGIGTEAKKFVIQSIGRGVRIEPVRNKRKRLMNLYNRKEDEGLFSKLIESVISAGHPNYYIVNVINPIETLFVFGTNRNALNEVINTLKFEKELEGTLDLTINENVQDRILLIPVYKESKKIYLEREPQKFQISKEHLNFLEDYFRNTDERILVTSHDISPELLQHIRTSFENQHTYYKLSTIRDFLPFRVIVSKILSHFNLNLQDLEKFKCLEDEIIHFKKIRVFFEKPEEFKELNEKINKVAKYPEKQKEEKKLKVLYGKVSPEEYGKKHEEISKKYSKEETYKDLKMKYIAEHYYVPLILLTKEKIDYIRHIIRTKSEVDFINNLEAFLEENRAKLNLDWWMFSKVDEYLDEVYVPYYDPESNMIRNFKPDFIFWLKKGDDYFIVFVDPKGITHTDFEYKVDGFRRIFGDIESPKIFEFENFRIKASLCLFTEDKNLLPEGYKRYWFDNPSPIFNFLTNVKFNLR